MTEESGFYQNCEEKYKFLGLWKAPTIFQIFNTSKGFLFFYTLFAIISFALSEGVFALNPFELETRFGFSSHDSAFIASGVNIGFCAFIFFVSYFGEKYNKAKAVAIGCLLFGVGCLIYSLPHFTTPLHVIANETERFQIKCKPWRHPSCDVDEDLYYTIYMLFVGQLLIGASLTPFYSLGLTYLEQSVSKRTTSYYFGHIYGCMNLGATIGIMAGGAIVRKLYVDFDQTDKVPPMTDMLGDSKFVDSRWVGAWWLFPLIAMGVSWTLSLIFMGFSPRLSGSSKRHNRIQTELYDYGCSRKTFQNFNLSSFKDLLRALLHLISNPTLMLFFLAGCMQTLIMIGSGEAIAKYYENAFNMNSEDSGMISGFFLAFGAILGSVVGGFLIYIFNWNVKQILKFSAFAMFLAAAASPGYLLYCENIKLAGVTVEYGGSNPPTEVNLTSPCNQHCLCQEEVYVPACGSDNITYFTPCQAGCNLVVAEYTYGSCDCVAQNQDNAVGFQPSHAVVDSCPTDCQYTPYAIALIFLVMFFLCLVFSPFLVVGVRVVPDSLKSLSLGLQSFLFRCLGVIPSSHFFKYVLSSACMLWSKNSCSGKHEKCLFYDNESLGAGLMLITMIGSLIAMALFLLSLYFYKPIHMDEKLDEKMDSSVSDESFASEGTQNTTKL